jgi:hypothetical protein
MALRSFSRASVKDSNRELLWPRFLELGKRAHYHEFGLMPELVSHYAHWMFYLASQNGQHQAAIDVLRPLLMAFAKPNKSNQHFLTPVHSALAKICLQSRQYQGILDILLWPVSDYVGMNMVSLPLTFPRS